MVSDYWLMQEGARPHRTERNYDLLTEHFHSGIIGLLPIMKTGIIQSGRRTPQILTRVTFLWGHLKDTLQLTQPKTLGDLRAAIEDKMKEFGGDLLQKTIGNSHSRFQNVICSNGDYFENLLY